MNLLDSPSYPSGHTTYGYTESVVLAILVPERYQQMITRAAEYGSNRIVVGAHYAMDVLGGRAVALHAVAHLLANDPCLCGPGAPQPGGGQRDGPRDERGRDDHGLSRGPSTPPART